MKKIAISIIMVLILLTSLAAAKCKAPEEVPPVIQGNIKYVAPHGSGIGLDQREVYIEARDAMTDKLLWELKIYTIKYKARMERDVQDIFIKKMELQDNHLVIWNERDDKFIVNLKTRQVKPKNKVYRI